MATIRITDLSLRTIIGIYDWERVNKQDVVINIEIDFDSARAAASDRVEDTVDYKTITKKIIAEVEESQYYLIEKLVHRVLGIVMEDARVRAARVRIDKPGALRFARSVSIEEEAKRS